MRAFKKVLITISLLSLLVWGITWFCKKQREYEQSLESFRLTDFQVIDSTTSGHVHKTTAELTYVDKTGIPETVTTDEFNVRMRNTRKTKYDYLVAPSNGVEAQLDGDGVPTL